MKRKNNLYTLDPIVINTSVEGGYAFGHVDVSVWLFVHKIT